MIRKKRRIPLLPNLITTGNIFAGFYSIIHSIHGDFRRAAWAIVIGGIFDLFDGRIARLTNSQSEFGVQYDSLSDLCTFGFAPAFLAYFWALEPYGRVGWLGAFLFVVCAALRLARFNVQGATEEKEYFQGIPSPGAAGLVVATVLFHQEFWNHQHLTYRPAQILFVALTYFLALLMVSGVRFRSFKTFNIRGIRPFQGLVLGALIITMVAYSPELALFVMGYSYLSMGIIETAFVLRRKSILPDDDDEAEADAGDDENNVTVLPS